MVGAGKQYASFSKISCIQEFSSWTVPFNHAHLTPSSCFLSSLMSQIRTKTILNSSTQLGYEFRRFACVVQCANQIVQSPNIISGISPGNLDRKRGLYLFRLSERSYQTANTVKSYFSYLSSIFGHINVILNVDKKICFHRLPTNCETNFLSLISP